MCNYMQFGDGGPQYYVREDNCMRMSVMRTAEEALENEAAWAKIEKRLAKEKFAKDGIKAAWAKEAMAKAAWEKAHGMAAEYANGYLSIAELACDEKKQQKKRKFPMLTSTSIEATDKAEFYCAQCELYLNGAEHYAEHMTREFHENRVPNLPIPNINAMDLMHVMDLGIGSMLSSSSSSK